MQTKEILREATLKGKYGERYNEILTVLEKAAGEVTETVQEDNQALTNAIIERLVDQRKADLNIPTDAGSSRATVQKSYKRTRQSERMKRIRTPISNPDLQMYDKWKTDNVQSKIPGISVPKMLLKLQQLEDEERREKTLEKSKKCARQLAHPYESPWHHTQNILRALQTCLQARDWDGMTSVLLMLVDRRNSQAFFPALKTMCEIMVEHNPMVEQLELTDQFKELFSNLVNTYKYVK